MMAKQYQNLMIMLKLIMTKNKITKIKIEKSPIRKPKKPRHLGSGYHQDGRKKREDAKLKKELEEND
jgi:hypothetical protein